MYAGGSNETYNQRRQAQLFATREHADCTFIFPATSAKLHAHRFLLTLHSPVFERMLYGALACAEIVVEDVPASAFDKLLAYVYTGVLRIESVPEAWQLIYASEKYMLQDLRRACVAFVRATRTLSSLLMCYEHATLYGDDQLAGECLEDIWLFGRGLLLLCGGDGDYHPRLATVRAVVQGGTLEAMLLAVRWALAECEERGVHASRAGAACILQEAQLLPLAAHLVDARLYAAVSNEMRDAADVYSALTQDAFRAPTAAPSTTARWRYAWRSELKIAGRLALRGSDATITSRLYCLCDCFLFSIAISTKSRPAHAGASTTAAAGYLGETRVHVYVEDNATMANLVCTQATRLAHLRYEHVQNVVFDVPVLCRAHVPYIICVQYAADASASTPGDDSVLLMHRGDKLSSARLLPPSPPPQVVRFSEEPNGGVVKGMCFYEV